MKNLIQAAVVVLFAASSAQAQQAVQWKASDGGNGHWYQFESEVLDWPLAQNRSTGRGAHLLTLTSQPEYLFVRQALQLDSQYFWLGGFQALNSCEPGCGWRWVTQEPWDYTNWNPGEPNNAGGNENWLECYPAGGWNDRYPGLMPSVREWDADCNGDGNVDFGQCHDGTLADFNGNNVPDCCERGEACVVGNFPVQWRVEDGGNGHWYRFAIGTTISWDSARLAAAAHGGYLASVTSQQESDFVVAVCGNTAGWIPFSFYWLGPWLGGFQPPNSPEPGGNWTWLSGEPWSWTKWWTASNEPNNGCSGHEDYLVMLTQAPNSGPSGWWNDAAYPDACGGPSPLSYVIEWSADCNHDGIVDYGQILSGQLADLNGNGIPDICEQPACHAADVVPNGRVDGADLGVLLTEWGPANASTRSDLNHDGQVDGADLAFVLSVWGPCN